MDFNKLADLLYPNVDKDINFYFANYPSRVITKNAVVTRFAPSPTGYLHIGALYQCVLHQMLTRQPSSVFYLRLEDTDQKREVEHAGSLLYKTLIDFDLEPMEGYRGDLPEKGRYGPYKQSERLAIYSTFAKYLVSRGRAYPCFCEKGDNSHVEPNDSLDLDIHENSVYEYDVCRNLTLEEVIENLSSGKPFALRLLSIGNPDKTMVFNDIIKGSREIRENGKDIVLIKSNGVPVYSFAHVVDDTLMGTTLIVRGEDWYQSVASHLEIFSAFGLSPIPYLHTPNICKLDDGRKRKLSKRKDPEADCRFFIQDGYPIVAIKEYLLNLLNSQFEDFRRENPYVDYLEFPFKIENISSGNPMFDIIKLNDVAKENIAKLPIKQLYEHLLKWALEYDDSLAKALQKDADYSMQVLDIERNGEKPRKDIYKWSMVKDYYNYMLFDYSKIKVNFEQVTSIENELLYKILHLYVVLFEEDLDKKTWFERVKKIAENNNFCLDNKEYKSNPDKYHGNVATLCNIIRYAFTGKTNTPDLYTICKILGKAELYSRLALIKKKLSV